jgi:hypothetical protein
VGQLLKFVSVLALIIANSGCAPKVKEIPFEPSNEQLVHSLTTSSQDEFTKLKKIVAPKGTITERLPYSIRNFEASRHYWLVAHQGSSAKQKEWSFQLELLVQGEEWYFIREAWTDRGQKLDLVQVDRDTGYRCIYETLLMRLKESDIRRYAKEGLRFQLIGDRGKVVMSIPSAYFSGFMSKFSEVTVTTTKTRK